MLEDTAIRFSLDSEQRCARVMERRYGGNLTRRLMLSMGLGAQMNTFFRLRLLIVILSLYSLPWGLIDAYGAL